MFLYCAYVVLSFVTHRHIVIIVWHIAGNEVYKVSRFTFYHGGTLLLPLKDLLSETKFHSYQPNYFVLKIQFAL